MIGLIFGDTDLPKAILNNIKKKKINYIIIDLSKYKKFKKDNNVHYISIGQFGKIIKTLKQNKCKKVLLAGKIIKPKLSSLRLDFKGFFYIKKIIKASKLGDAAIISEIIKILSKDGIKVISSTTFNPELSLKKGNFTNIKPNDDDKDDITKGIIHLFKLNKYNHTQGLVVRNNKVIIKEGIKGTKKMIQFIKKNKKRNGILIKFPKKKQDLRVDLPTIGLDTFKDCKKSGLKGIVLKANQNIIMDKNKCLRFANKNSMFLKVI